MDAGCYSNGSWGANSAGASAPCSTAALPGLYGEHRDGRMAYDLLGDASDQQVRKARSSLGRHHDAVHLLRCVEDARGGVAQLHVEAEGRSAATAQLAPNRLVPAPLG